MFQGYIARRWGDKMFEEDIAKVVKKRAFWAAIVAVLPLIGFEYVFYIYILWNMYSTICKKVGTTLKFGTIAVGYITNIAVYIALDLILTAIPVIGWLGTGFVVYMQFYFSGKMFIETLKKAFPNETNLNNKEQISQRCYSDNYLSDNNLTESMDNTQRPVMLFFYATWCNICKTVKPLVEGIERDYNGRINVKKVDVDTNPDLVAKYNIKYVPTILFFKSGCDQYKDLVTGVTTKEILKQKLNDLL